MTGSAAEAPGEPEATETLPRTGYAANFLGTRIDPPTLDAGIEGDAVEWEGATSIPYTHFSLSLSISRRLARWVGWNIDGAYLLLLSRTGIGFAKDPRLPAETQSGNELYAGNRLDRGHLARRSDLLWGAGEVARGAAGEPRLVLRQYCPADG
jgi:endonuclease G